MNTKQIRQSLISEIDTRLPEIEDGSQTWFSLKVIRNRNGEIRATVQAEQDIRSCEEGAGSLGAVPGKIPALVRLSRP